MTSRTLGRVTAFKQRRDRHGHTVGLHEFDLYCEANFSMTAVSKLQQSLAHRQKRKEPATVGTYSRIRFASVHA